MGLEPAPGGGGLDQRINKFLGPLFTGASSNILHQYTDWELNSVFEDLIGNVSNSS